MIVILLYLFTICMAGVVSYFSLQYFSLVLNGRKVSKKESIYKWIVLCSVADGALGLLCAINLESLYVVTVVCVAIAIEGWFITSQTIKNVSLGFFLLLASFLNFSCMYIITYSLGGIVCTLFKIEQTLNFYIVVFGVSTLESALLVRLLITPGVFPNDILREIINSSRRKIIIMIYFAVFSVANGISLFCFVPTISRIAVDNSNLIPLYFDSYIRVSLVVFSSFFLVYYFCKLSGSETDAISLKHKLKQESSYRKSILSDSIISYCTDLDDARVLEGSNYFKNLFDDVTPDSCSQIFAEICHSLVHPDDFTVLEPLLCRENILEIMKDKSVLSQEIRVLDDALKAFAANDIDYIKKLIKSNGTTDVEPTWRWVEARYSLTKDESDGHYILYTIISDIQNRIEEELRLRDAAEHDALTSLYNRAYLFKNLKDRLDNGENVSVFIIDADHLKQVNDLIDHAAGDKMLLNIATILKNEFSVDDTVARLGGDEFVVVTNGNQNFRKIKQRANRLNSMARLNYMSQDGSLISTSISIGIAISPLHGKTPEELIQNADAALLWVKKGTRNNNKIYESHLRS